MSAFNITVRTAHGVVRYQAIAASSCDAIASAIDCFGLASVTVLPIGGHHGQV